MVKPAAAKAMNLLLGITISVAVVELGLFILGMFFKSDPSLDTMHSDKNAFTVMCIGDSFVYGLGASPDKSYPRQLEALLRSRFPEKNIRVINTGRAGKNTTQILERFRKEVDIVRPELVIFLGGLINDGMNTYGLHAFTSENTVAARVTDLCNRSRTFRLMQYLYRNLREKNDVALLHVLGQSGDLPAGLSAAPKPLLEVSPKPGYISLVEEGNRCLSAGDLLNGSACMEKAIEMDPSLPSPYGALAGVCALTGRHWEAIRYYRLCLARSPQDKADIYWKLGMVYIYLEKYDNAFSCFRDGVEVNREDGRCYCGMRTLLQKREASSVHERVKEYLREVEKTVHNRDMRAFISVLGKRQNTEVVNRWREHDINEIIDLCEQKRIGVIIMNYPETDLGGLYERIAAHRNIPFVDNRTVFNDFASKHPREDFVGFDNSHCNASGYGIMAKNVCDVIVKKRLLDDRRAQ